MDERAVSEYLERIGLPRPPRPDHAALTALMAAHLRAVPFENLSVHLDEPVSLDETALLDKIVRRRRGGFCYELNGAFAGLLRALGFPVRMLAVRAYGEHGLNPPFDHLALSVPLEDTTYLVDVGFGAFAVGPLDMGRRDVQVDGGGRFVVRDAPHGDLEVLHDDAPTYRVELRERELADFGPTCWWQTTSPDSHFTSSTICSRLTDDGGRVTLSGQRMITTDPAGDRTERTLAPGALLDTYRAVFGIPLDRPPAIRAPR